MVNAIHTYFDKLLTQGDLSVLEEILDPTISHKDMVGCQACTARASAVGVSQRLHCVNPLVPQGIRRQPAVPAVALQVRNIGRVGQKEYTSYLADLHKTYPDYYVKPTSVRHGWAPGSDGRLLHV
jgi:hypothetical protein